MNARSGHAHASRLAAMAAGIATGATGWVSLGVLALVDPTRMTRLGALPPYAWLAGLCLTGAVLGVVLGRRLRLAPLTLLVLPWLPWLPWPVPDAFLLWDGPLEGAIWLAVAAGVAWSFIGPQVHRAAGIAALCRSPRLAPWLVAALSAVLFATAWQTARPRVPAGDEPHYLVITQSLLRDGDLRIENNHRENQYLAYFDGGLKPDFMRRGTDGQIYSIHAPGVAVLVLPAFAAAGYAGAVLFVVLCSAFGMAAAWHLGYRLTGSAGAAWAAWAVVATSAPVVLHSFTIYPDPLGGVLALAGLVALVSLETQPGRWPGRAWVLTGAALAVLPWLHTRFALIAGVLGLAIVLRLWSRDGGRHDIARLLAAPAVSALTWFSYFWLIYGTPNPAAPYGTRPEGGLSFVPAGVAGLLVDQQFGLLVDAPALAVGIVGLAIVARRRPRLAVELLAVFVPYLLTAASYPMWWGGYSAPARFIVVLVPMLALPAALLWAQGTAMTRAAVGGVTALSALLTAALVGIDRGAFIYNGRDGHSLLLDWLSRTVDVTLAFPSVHRDGSSAAAADAAVWVVAATLIGAAVVRLSRAAPGAGRIAGVAAVPVVLMLGSTVVWRAHDRGALTPSTSQMSWLERWFPDRAPVTLLLAPTRRITVVDAPRRLNIGTSVRGPQARADGPLLRIPELPAGDYDLFIEPHGTLAGELTVRLGRQDVAMERWPLEARPAGFSGLVLRLPVDAHSITVSGDVAARASVRRLTLRPRDLAVRDTASRALRAGRYGSVVVHALDDNAYLEPGALWVRGERTAGFVVQPDQGLPAVVRLKAGPVANEVRLSAGTWSRVVPLAADAEADLPLPASALAPARLSVTSTTGFRPSAYGGGADVRWLGVYLTWPGGAAPSEDTTASGVDQKRSVPPK